MEVKSELKPITHPNPVHAFILFHAYMHDVVMFCANPIIENPVKIKANYASTGKPRVGKKTENPGCSF